jgi:hypothetical protein
MGSSRGTPSPITVENNDRPLKSERQMCCIGQAPSTRRFGCPADCTPCGLALSCRLGDGILLRQTASPLMTPIAAPSLRAAVG